MVIDVVLPAMLGPKFSIRSRVFYLSRGFMRHYVLVLVGEASVETWWKSCQFGRVAAVDEMRLNQGAGIV